MKKNEVNRQSKDTVFSYLFQDKENILKLYRDLHPDDGDIIQDDLQNITLENILINGMYNDLGFRVKDRFIILLESQSTWSMNILVRSLFYMADTYKRYLIEKPADLYSTSKVELPEPEFYLVYTKACKEKPEILSLREEFFGGKEIPLELKMKVIYDQNKAGILEEYIAFCKVFDAQVDKYGYTRKAMEKTIEICKNQKILVEFLKKREGELMEMMDYLYNDEIIMRNHDAQLVRETEARAEARGISIGRSEGISIGEVRGWTKAEKKYQAEIAALKAQLAQARKQ